VTVIEALERLLSREEPFAGEQVSESLAKLGVQVLTGVRANAASRDGEQIRVRLENGQEVLGDRLLVAIGREPLTRGLEDVGLPAGGYLEVDDHMQVIGAPGLYAVGDVNGRSLLTHSGKYQARIACRPHPRRGRRGDRGRAIAPRVVFSDPQVAAVGLTLAAALQAGISAEAIDLPTGGSAGASFYGRGARGTTRFVVDSKRELLVGATFVGPEVADFLQAATIAIVGEVPRSRLAHAIAPFPTRSELWLKFIEAYEQERGTTLHARRVPVGAGA
jgi:dihydrolipoamide dehydrogenase